MIVISGADQNIGHAITSHLARFEHIRPHIRALCVNKAPCLNFAKKGIMVNQVDYMNVDALIEACTGAHFLIMAVGNEANRVEYCKRLCEAAENAGVQSVICISHVGAVSSMHESLRHFADIEDEVISLNCAWTIVRPDWIHQNFHLWAPLIEKRRELHLPVPEQTELCPIDMVDICKVIECFMTDAYQRLLSQLPEEYNGQVYVLTGSQAVDCKQLMTSIAKATGYQKLKYRQVRPMDTAYYLKNLPHDIWFDARIKREKSLAYQDTLTSYEYRSRAFDTPTETQIQTFLDYFDWIHKTSSSVCVPHTSLITCMPSRSIHRFFQEYANSFKPRV